MKSKMESEYCEKSCSFIIMGIVTIALTLSGLYTFRDKNNEYHTDALAWFIVTGFIAIVFSIAAIYNTVMCIKEKNKRNNTLLPNNFKYCGSA